MSKRQISKIFSGVKHLNREEERWFERLLERNNRFQVCGAKENLQLHHIIQCHIYDKLYFDIEATTGIMHKRLNLKKKYWEIIHEKRRDY